MISSFWIKEQRSVIRNEFPQDKSALSTRHLQSALAPFFG